MKGLDTAQERGMVERFERLARKALTAYGLEDAELRLIHSSRNVVFLVQTDDGRWALRICAPERDRKALLRELLWLVALGRDTALGIPEPVISRSGELFRSVSTPGLSGFRSCTLFRWVKGQVEDDPTADHLRSIGALMAGLHKHAETFRWPEELAVDSAACDPAREIVPRTALRALCPPADADLLCAAVPIMQRTIRSLGFGREILGVIHGDLLPGNYLFFGDEARAIDFESVQWNYYAYDIATTLGTLRTRSDAAELQEAYASGYEQIRPLPCDLGEHLPAFEMLRCFNTLAEAMEHSHPKADSGLRAALDKAIRRARSLTRDT